VANPFPKRTQRADGHASGWRSVFCRRCDDHQKLVGWDKCIAWTTSPTLGARAISDPPNITCKRRSDDNSRTKTEGTNHSLPAHTAQAGDQARSRGSWTTPVDLGGTSARETRQSENDRSMSFNMREDLPAAAALEPPPSAALSRRGQLVNMTNDIAVLVWLRHKSALLRKCGLIGVGSGRGNEQPDPWPVL
jgi:hypothetical protein